MSGSLQEMEKGLYDEMVSPNSGAAKELAMRALLNASMDSTRSTNLRNAAQNAKPQKKPMIYIKNDPLNDVSSSILKMIPYGIIYKIAEAIPATGYKLIDSVIDMGEKAARQKFYATGKNELPTLFNNMGFMSGGSTTQEYYTAEVDIQGKKIERPIYIRRKGKNPPGKDFFAKSCYRLIETVSNELNGLDELNKELLEKNPLFSYTGADMRYMNNDLRRLEDLEFFWSEWAKMDIWHIQQFGHKQQIDDLVVGVKDNQGNTINVNAKIYKYIRPSPLVTWAFYQTGNVIYDLFDNLIYNPIQAAFGSSVSQQIPIVKQFQGTNDIVKSVWKPFSNQAELDHYT